MIGKLQIFSRNLVTGFFSLSWAAFARFSLLALILSRF